MRLTGAEERTGLAKVGRGARGARVDGGAAVSDGARTPLGGDESRRASSTGANPGGGGGSASPSPRGRTAPGWAPPEGYRGGGRGWAPGLWGPGSGSSRAGAGETGRAVGLRLVRGGRGRAGLARGRTPRGPRGPGEGSRGRPLPGGGGGVAPCPGDDGGPSRGRGGGAGRVLPGVGPCHFLAARHGTITPTLRAGVPFGGGGGGLGGGGLAVVVCTLPCGGGFAGGSSVRRGRKNPVASPGLVGPFEEEPRIRRGGLR